MSPERSDNEDARLWFNCVEELVFTDEDFNSDMTYLSSTPLNLRSDRVQALQAAYMVCLYQNWEGSDVSKRRIRRHRFATLVSVSLQWIPLPRLTGVPRRRVILTCPRCDMSNTVTRPNMSLSGRTSQRERS